MALTFYTVLVNQKGYPVKYIRPTSDGERAYSEVQTFAPRSFSDPGEACNEFEASIGTAPRCYLEQSNFKKKVKALRRMKRVIERNEQPALEGLHDV